MEAYAKYGPALLRKCRRMVQSSADAEDLVHGLFVDLMAMGNTCWDLPFSYRSVTNRCLNFLRDEKNRARLRDHNETALRGPIRRCLEDERVVGYDLLLRLVKDLDGKCAEVMVFYYFDDLDIQEIASLLHTSRKTIGKRLATVKEEAARLAGIEEGRAS